MSGTSAKHSIHDRTRAAIIEAAARLVGDEGLGAKLDSVAEYAGVSRATLYRYFSSRDELVQALIDAAYADVIERVRDANIDDVPFPEAFARLARAVAQTGSHFVVLQSTAVAVPVPHLDEEFEQALDNLFDRGKSEGFLRADLSTPWLRAAYRGINIEATRHAAAQGLGAESTAALVVDQFLTGAAKPA
jgi:AcrR family transcriptional regulator